MTGVGTRGMPVHAQGVVKGLRWGTPRLHDVATPGIAKLRCRSMIASTVVMSHACCRLRREVLPESRVYHRPVTIQAEP